ncbi:hypothetical protein DMH04_12020 [Kibdelosporangium aridum]|uniref:Uncharacterized protein n=1 Tax=Kibdelosporangium aridum TaxID=2030 RepID=A0A428ZG78_KIBAR|nr:hypothetical protein DMH04_12020 [Kibdelosporangium aridum]
MAAPADPADLDDPPGRRVQQRIQRRAAHLRGHRSGRAERHLGEPQPHVHRAEVPDGDRALPRQDTARRAGVRAGGIRPRGDRAHVRVRRAGQARTPRVRTAGRRRQRTRALRVQGRHQPARGA